MNKTIKMTLKAPIPIKNLLFRFIFITHHLPCWLFNFSAAKPRTFPKKYKNSSFDQSLIDRYQPLKRRSWLLQFHCHSR
jgi:hypothetical protein